MGSSYFARWLFGVLKGVENLNNISPKGKRIGFVSTGFAGVDGVSLGFSKWAKIFEEIGCT